MAVIGARRALISSVAPITSWDATKGVLPSWLTFTGSNKGTYFNSSGVLTQASTNTPRFDYDPVTLSPKGLLIEEARTNVVLYSRDLTNGAWSPTNMNRAKDQTGLDGVANSASSITASATNGTILQAITLSSSARFQTAYVKRITGSGSVSMTTDGGATWTAISVPATWGRVSIPTQTLANPSVGFKIATNGDAIAIDLVQNENGAFATSAIPTTTASVTRSVDYPVGSMAGAGVNLSQGTISIRFQPSVVPQNASAILLEGINASGGYGPAMLGISSVGTGPLVVDRIVSGGRQFSINGILSTASVVQASVSYGTLADAGSVIGISDAYVGTGGASAASTQFGLGSRAGASLFFNGWIRGLAIYNRMLTQSQQNQLTGKMRF